MSLLTPLGLFGLLSIVALIIIYIIRPNYQEKFISTTFVWNLSLKYRKKRIPTSKIRNILLIICQVLILLLATSILTTPSQVIKAHIDEPEIIIILDSSASMRTTSYSEEDGVDRTRFERALAKSKEKADEVFEKDGTVSLIIATEKPQFVFTGIKKDTRVTLDEKYAAMTEQDVCAYGTSDLEKAVDLCADIFEENPSAEIFIYTDGTYAAMPTDGITVVNVGESSEWNAAILSAEAEKENGYYLVQGKLACYNRSEEITVTVGVYDANGVVYNDINTNFTVDCVENVPVTFMLIANDGSTHENFMSNFNTIDPTVENYVVVCDIGKVYSFSSININLEVEDSLAQDDNFNIYGGELEEIKVEYASTLHNTFMQTILDNMRDYYGDRQGMWDFAPYETIGTSVTTEGYDFYIFEHSMPSTMPQDGYVVLVNPNEAPKGAGFSVSGEVDLKASINLVYGEEHYINTANNLSAAAIEDITIYKYQKIVDYDPDYVVLVEFNGDPIIMVKDDGPSKVVVMAFSVHYSNISMKFEPYVFLWANIFEYFNPTTVVGNYFEVGDTVTFNSRSDCLYILGNEVDVELDRYDGQSERGENDVDFPTEWTFYTPGTYTLSQTTYYDKPVEERIFVKAPASESDIFELKDTLINPYGTIDLADFYKDLMLYFAIALEAILFVEWLLQARDNM